MKSLHLFPKHGRSTLAGLMIGTGLITLLSLYNPARLDDNSRQLFLARINDGIGSAVSFPAPNSSVSQIRQSVDASDRFIYDRSGQCLSETTKKRLVELEASVLSGSARHLSVNDLTDVLTSVALERASLLTDAEIKHAVETLRGFDTPDLPEGLRLGRDATRLRASKVGPSPEELTEHFMSLRSPANRSAYESAARNVIDSTLKGRLSLFSAAAPQQWGGAWNPVTNSEGAVGISPQQALILTYSIASDDYLEDSVTNLRARMGGMRQALIGRLGHYPSPDGHFAYGVNGYFYSTPINLVFDVATVGRFLDRVEERSRG